MIGKITKPKKTTGRVVKVKPDLTAENELLKKANQELTVKLAIAKQLGDENIQDLEKRLDLSYREQEEMLKELDKCVNATIRHCDQVQYNTGSIALHDVEYCVDMINRIMEHKFGYKPKMQEL
jgi:hypothetical protein